MGSYRLDRGNLRKPRFTSDGRAIMEGFFTRSGVFKYRNPDGSERNEYRPPEEVFSEKSLATARLAPVTNEHPPPGLLSAKNAKKFAVGSTGQDVRRDDDHVAGTIMVLDADTITAIKAGKVELSCGYECDIDETPGVAPDGQRYDAVQRNIRVNHLAIVGRARAGQTARIRMDAAVRIDDERPALPYRKEPMMSKTKMRSGTISESQAAELIQAAEARADAAEAKLSEVEEELSTLRGKSEGLQSRVDALETEVKDAPDPDGLREEIRSRDTEIKRLKNKIRTDAEEQPKRLRRLVNQRTAVLRAAEEILGPGERYDTMDDRALMLACIQKTQGVNCTEQSDAYVKARFDVAMENYSKGEETLARLRLPTKVEPEEIGSAEGARAKMVSRQRDAWKKPDRGQA